MKEECKLLLFNVIEWIEKQDRITICFSEKKMTENYFIFVQIFLGNLDYFFTPWRNFSNLMPDHCDFENIYGNKPKQT